MFQRLFNFLATLGSAHVELAAPDVGACSALLSADVELVAGASDDPPDTSSSCFGSWFNCTFQIRVMYRFAEAMFDFSEVCVSTA